MKTTLQATGHAPRGVEYDGHWHSIQMLVGDKRGVAIDVYHGTNCWWAVLSYLTSWPSERSVVRTFHSPELVGATFLGIDGLLREAAKTMLPPGAGYPAMPQYESRQAKLAGMLEVATLTALSEVLAAMASAAR